MNYDSTIDFHCHPSLKTYLFNSDLFERHKTSKEFNPFHVQVDFPKMQEGDVKAILAAHYLPEVGLRKECKSVKGIYGWIEFLFSNAADKLESDENFQAPFEQTMQILTHFESKIHEARSKGFDVSIARTYNEFEQGLQDGKTMILHTIEGGHSLGRKNNSALVSPQDYINNLMEFYERGVCMITLSHFFSNDIANPVEGIPPSIRKLLKCNPRDLNLSLTEEVGEVVVNKILEQGIIVDLTHSTPNTRARVFEINNGLGDNKRPIVFSHVGVADLFDNPDLPTDKVMNPTNEEILKIKDCNGLIGVVFINYWLTGKEEKDFLFLDLLPDPGFPAIYNTIEHIHQVTGSYDNIALGSDFDGFTDPPDDLKGCSKFPDLLNFLLEKGISQSDLQKITSGNILRVLHEGWGR